MYDSLMLADQIGIDKNLIQSLQFLDWNKVFKLTKKCHRSFSALEQQNDKYRLAVCLCYASTYAKPFYDEKGISNEIFLHTMSDIRIWTENDGNKGLKNYRWVKNAVSCELFRLGRLQFQFCNVKGILRYKNLPFSRGESVLNIHIPRGEKLETEECLKSLSFAERFFAEYFPDFEYEYYYCNSWLLYKNNSEFMDRDSNIIRFANLFDIAYSYPLDIQPIDILFGQRQKNADDYPEDRTLQKRAKNYMKSGGKLGIGIGTIKRKKA